MSHKLQLQEIAGYLPYRIQVEIERLKYPIQSEIVELTVKNIHQIENTKLWRIKPILRSLSDLKKEITHKGKTFVPIEWLEDFYYTHSFHTQCEQLISDYRWINHLDYLVVQHLLEWHFDIHNLIGRGLAIDINTLKY